MKLILGDCLEKMKELEDNSVDAIVTDPPYELGFMGKGWDSTGIAYDVDMWKECLRVLKPGGHLLSFSGTRTYHRMAVAIEDAGFQIRDMIEYCYGSGFPKSLNIGKAVDKIAPRLGQFDEFAKHLTEQIKSSGKSQKEISILFPSKTGGLTGCVWNWANGANVPTVAQWNILKPLLDLSDDFLPLIERIEREREVVGKDKKAELKDHVFFGDINKAQENGKAIGYGEWDITKGTSEFEGWGTALKPAHEPICMARKPLAEKTVAENCLKWGTGGINIDESRVEHNEPEKHTTRTAQRTGTALEMNTGKSDKWVEGTMASANPQGRFPANLLHDNSEEVRECFPETNRIDKRTSCKASSFFKSIVYIPKASKSERNKGCEGLETKQTQGGGGGGGGIGDYQDDVNSMSGKYGSEKAPANNFHPTVKPIALMEYLIKMVTPKGGVVLDPFMGSGSTGVACKKNGFDFIGIEMEAEYMKIAEARMEAVKEDDPTLF